MASTSRRTRSTNVLNKKYMDSLEKLCDCYRPKRHEIEHLFQLYFRRALTRRRAKRCSRARSTAADSPSTSRDTPRRPVTFSYRRMLGGYSISFNDDYSRSCTFPRDQPCWLFRELEQWNSQLAKGCFELLAHKCYELELVGYRWPSFYKPRNVHVFRTALLTHLLLKRHSCVTRVVVDLEGAKLERRMFWDAMAESACGVLFLDFRADIYNGEYPVEEHVAWVSSVSVMFRLVSLNLSRILFNEQVSIKLARYVMATTALVSLSLTDIMAEETAIPHFLESLARNKSLKKLCLHDAFLSAQSGKPLADAVRDHKALEELEVRGSGLTSPSALLRGAAQSKSLRCLNVYFCQASVADINELAVALTRRPLSPSSFEGTSSQPLTPTSRLQRLGFFHFAKCDDDLERAYASLIGGVLLSLTLSACHLTDTFGMAAAVKLRKDGRLLELDVAKNLMNPDGIYPMVHAMQVNRSLETLTVSILSDQPEHQLGRLFSLIRALGVSARLQFHWEKPPGHFFPDRVRLSRHCNCELDLDHCGVNDASDLLNTLSTSRHIRIASIHCTSISLEPVIGNIADAVRSAMYLRHLTLNVDVKEPEMLKLLGALEGNRTVGILELPTHLFSKRVAKAMGRLVKFNRTIYSLTIIIDGEKKSSQMSRFYHEMKWAVPLNRFLIAVNLMLCNVNQATMLEVKQTLCRNMMKVHEAIRFVHGSSEVSHALAFEDLEHTYSVEHVLSHNYGLDKTTAAEKVIEARSRLRVEYFVLTGVVRGRVTCEGEGALQPSLSDLSVSLLAYICSHLCIGDVKRH
ncbi:uncharacterized protein [Dermacentor andersoni]|uniref:uncharacterized protein n=1 Tax=Dermacentor andersoni TaxID=34620 RepID=UPI002416AA7B|nr:uncharacterized protein LOC129384118 [Dermacentor andersoni]